MEDIEDIGKGEGPLQQRFKDNYAVKVKSLKASNKPSLQNIDKTLPGQGRVFIKTFGCSHNISDS